MKKLILWLALLGCGCGVQAQPGWSVSPRLGMPVSFVDGDSYPLLGFYTGLLGQYRFNNIWALESGLLYSLEYHTRWEDASGNSMLHLPVQAKAYLKNGWNVVTGPQFNARFGKGGGTFFGVSWMLGTGYDFPCGLLLNFDYGFGGPDAFEMKMMGRNRSSWHRFQIGLGWRFGRDK